MSSLNASLATALSGLTAEQGALETTANNVANANNPVYSREVPIFASSDPVVLDSLTLGSGVKLVSIKDVRDSILESQIQQETQSQGELTALVSALSQTQTTFTSTTADIGTAISNFFNSLNQLSTSPADLSLRQNVLTQAGNVARAFNLSANNLGAQRTSLDQSVEQSVTQINQLTTQISSINTRISALENAGESAGSLVDNRTDLINQLSSLIDVSVIPSGNTVALTTANGTALVDGQVSFQLSVAPDTSGVQHIFSQGRDITSTIVSGALGGILQARDLQIPSLQAQLDTLAAGLANAVNEVQTQGYDLNGNPTTATPIFEPPPASGIGAAAGLSLVIQDPSLIGASSDGTPGNNANLEAMYALRNATFVDGQSPTDYFSRIVFAAGNAAANAAAEQSASDSVLQQLKNQRSSISGVSLDEEAANMIRYQQAYAASAQVITAIDQMMQTVINMKAD
jgi:flagellar hook-associated protein 1 FlgK